MAIGSRLRDLRAGSGLGSSPSALIVVLAAFGPAAEQALTLARHWQPSVPQAAFVDIAPDCVGDLDSAALRQDIVTAAAAHGVQMSQIILLGAGAAGRLALDIVLQGIVPAMGVIGLGLAPCSVPSRIAHGAAMVRLIQHRAGGRAPPDFLALVEAIQRRDIDLRTMLLPDSAQTTSDVTLRAGATFLAELVANAGHLTLATRR
jgi:hypothetical protein